MQTDTPAVQKELLARSANGEEWPMRIRIGMPVPSEIAQWSCMVEVDRLFSPSKPIYGADSWQAMQLAQHFAVSIVERFQSRGGMLFWPREEPHADLQAFTVEDLLPHRPA
jgi:hypothetical protein